MPTTAGRSQLLDATEVQVGDILVFGGSTHRVVSIEPYEHSLLGPSAGIARCEGDWQIVLYRGTRLEVIR